MHDLLKWDYEQKAHYNRDYLRDYKASGMHDTNDTNVSFASYGKPPLGTWDPVANVMHGLDGDPQMNRTFLSSNVGIEGKNFLYVGVHRALMSLHKPFCQDVRLCQDIEFLRQIIYNVLQLNILSHFDRFYLQFLHLMTKMFYS